MALLSVIVAVILYFCSVNEDTIAIVSGTFCIVTIIVLIFTVLITAKVADLREQRNYKPKK